MRRWKTVDRRKETGDRRKEMGEGRQEKGDRIKEKGEGRKGTVDRRGFYAVLWSRPVWLEPEPVP